MLTVECPIHGGRLRHPRCNYACWAKYAELHPIPKIDSATASFGASPSLKSSPGPTLEVAQSPPTFTPSNSATVISSRSTSIKRTETSTITAPSSPRVPQITSQPLPPSSLSATAVSIYRSTMVTAERASSPTPESESKKRPAPTDINAEKMPAKKARTKAKSYALSEIVNVVVGPKKRHFHIHEDLLLSESNSIASQIVRPSAGSMKELKLFDVPVIAVEVVVDYLYHDDFAKSASWEPATNLDPFLQAWILADQLDMEDAKNAIMDRLRFTVDMAYTHELEGASDATLVREAVAMMQLMVPQPRRWCPLYTFLIHRLARDLSKVPSTFGASTSAYLDASFQEILRKGGDVVVDIFMECFVTKFPAGSGLRPDPAALKGCHFHDHTPGRRSRVCSESGDSRPIDDASQNLVLKIEPTRSTTSNLFGRPTISAFGASTTPRVSDPFPIGSTAGPGLFGTSSTSAGPAHTRTTQNRGFSASPTAGSFKFGGPKP